MMEQECFFLTALYILETIGAMLSNVPKELCMHDKSDKILVSYGICHL